MGVVVGGEVEGVEGVVEAWVLEGVGDQSIRTDEHNTGLRHQRHLLQEPDGEDTTRICSYYWLY